MEELYILSDGSTVDISKYSKLEKMNFLLNNEGAKKLKGGAKSAVVAPKNKQALRKSTDSKSVDGPSNFQKFRLPTVEELQKKGEAPPPSESASPEIMDASRLYNMVGNTGNKVNKQNFKLATTEGKKEQKTTGYSTAGQGAVDDLIESIDNPGNKNNNKRDLKYDIDTIKNKIQLTDSELLHPYLYYSSKSKKIDDSFVDKNYNSKELESIGVNSDDFDGFLNKKGYKDDFLKKEAEGIYEGTGNATLARYDIGLAKELAKKKMLNMYMEDMQKRDFTRQDLNQDLEITFGVRDKKEIVQNDIFDPVGISKYVQKNFPIVTQKLKDRDIENRKIYDESKKGGTDFFSWDTVGKMGKSGWNAVVDRTKQISAATYSVIGMEATAEGIRALDEENKFIRPDDRGVSYASGKTTSYNGNDYLVDSRGEIYDKDAKIRVTDLFDESEYKNIVETSKYGSSDWMFSPQGAAVQTSGVMADMLIQAAVTRGVGEFGAIASEARVALNGARQTSKFTSLLNDSSQLLRKIPLDRATGYSMIAQGALGYSQGYEDTLKAARDSGINDTEAFKLASTAAQRMAVLYSTTGAINPQTKLAENVFGSKNIIKKAINQYLETGEKGFVGYIDDIIKSTPRNIVEFAEEGGKEVIQENIQQVGELGVNKLTNEQAGKKILNETMSGDDFMNTSILSFISSGLISKMKMPSFKTGNQDTDNLSSLSTLAKNRKEFVKIVDNLVNEKVFTPEQVNNLKSDVDIYSNNINKMPKDTSSKAAMPILRSLDKIQKLRDEKESLDKAFHPSIDEKIKKEEAIADDLYYADDLETKNKLIKAAIDKKVIKDIEMQTFGSSAEIKQYLIDVVGMPEDEADSNSKRGGFFLDDVLLTKYANQSGKDTSGIVKGKKVIFVNEDVSIKGGTTDVAQHEFLHGLIYETLKNSPESQILLGKALHKEIIKISKTASDENTVLPQAFKDRINKYSNFYMDKIAAEDLKLQKDPKYKRQYDEKVSEFLGNSWEEVLTLYSNAISNGSVQFNENVFTGLKDTVRQVLQNLGLRKVEFKSGRDVYNFLKDYNKSVTTGNFGIPGIGAMRTLGQSKAFIDKEALRLETGENIVVSQGSGSSQVKPSLGGNRRSGEKKSSDDIKKDVDSAYNKETFSQKINSQRDPLLYDIVEEYEYLIRGKAKSEKFFSLPGFKNDREEREKDFVQETKIELMSHIRNFNKEFLVLREEYKQDLISKGFDPNSKEFKEILDAKDAEGYKGEKGIVKENNSLNGWINSQVLNKMRNALKRAGIVDKKFDLDFGGEDFVEGRGTTDIGEELDYLSGDGVDVMEATEDFNEEQEKLANILKDPVFRFVDEKGDEVIIDTVPERGDYVISAKDQGIEANKQLKTETDPVRIEELKKDLRDLQRGLDLQNKEEPLTPEEKQELKSLKPTKAFNLTTGNVEYVFKAIIKKESPARIVARQVADEILRSPNIETLEFRNFKKLLADKSMVMMKRITFETGEGLESLMYNNWKLVYDVINNPVDEVTGQSSYASKKIPPYLKERNEKGEFQKVKDINRAVFLQSFYSEEDANKIIRKYNSVNPEEEISKFLDYEQLTTNAWFDRRTALRELFGDVMVLQEARRLLRNPDFIEQIGQEKPNLYNSLKDDVIRTQVLNDLAKGKSSSVKFSLEEEKRQGQYKLLNKTQLLKTQKALSEGIANNVYYGIDSMPVISDTIKFSLSEVLDQESDPDLPIINYKGYNKKYENNYKDLYSKIIGDIQYIDAGKNYYIKALQYSDTVDTAPGSVKLHTLKNYEEVEKEVVRRTIELIDLMNIPIGNTNGTINPFLIKDYTEDYIDRMLEEAMKDEARGINRAADIDHFTALKNNDTYREEDIFKKQELQYESIQSLLESVWYRGDFDINFIDEEGENFEKIPTAAWHNGSYMTLKPGLEPWNANGATVKYEKPNGLKLNPFFAYLFLNDVLSNRYIDNPISQTIERKPFKRSQYSSTLKPIDSYNDEDLIEKVYRNYSHTELKNPAFIYGFLNMQKNKKYISDWETNRKVSDSDNKKIFKFDKSDKEENILSLNSLASRNVNSNALWCTGQRSLSFATTHLKGGDFFIASDNDYKPSIAVRLQDSAQFGVGEVVGVEEGQSFKAEEIPLISEVFKLSNVKEKQDYIDSMDLAYSLLTDENEVDFKNNSKEKNTKLIKNVSSLNRGNFFRFELEIDSRKELEEKISDIKSELRSLDLLEPIRNIGELIDSNFNILINREEELDILKEQEEISQDEFKLDIDDEYISIDFADGKLGYYDMPNLIKIDLVSFRNAYGFDAPNLMKGNKLDIEGKMMEGRAFLTLPDNIYYDLNVDADITRNPDQDEFDTFWLSMEPINFNNGILNLVTTFDSQEKSMIDISSANNTEQIYLYGLASQIILPKKVDDLRFLFGEHNNSIPKEIELFGGQNIGVLHLDLMDSYITKKDKAIDFVNMYEFSNDNIVVDELKINIKEQLTDELKESILKSSIGSSSNKISVRVGLIDEDNEAAAGGYYYRTTVIKSNEENDSAIKYSLAETANAAISPLLSGLNLTQQSVIARDIDKAIMNGKLSELAKNTEMDKLTAKLKKQTDPIEIKKVRQEMSDLFQADTVLFKVPRMSDSTDKAIATFIINKMAEGYNSFDFHVKKNADGTLTKQVLNALDANSEKIKQTAFRNSNLELTMNEIIEENKGIPRTEIFSEETAKNIGKGKKLDFAYLPPGDEDFEGLLYKLASGKGTMGEAQLEFFNENLIRPYSEAMTTLMVARQKMYSEWKDLITKEHKGIIKLLSKQTDYEGYTYDQAVRVYLWDKAKYPIPGINNRDKFNLTDIVRTNPKLKDFANSVSLLSKQANGYIEPEKNWSFGSILGDMNNIISTVNRAKYLQDWQNRADKIFSKENLSKIEAVYGGEYVKALKNMLGRLKSGTNRNPGANSKLLNWLNKSTANVMFLNTRSAVLQLLSAVNFINTSDNNITQVAAAFANQPQFWKDVKYLWNSPYLKDRRSGLMNDVAESEIAQLMDSQKGDDSINKYRRIVNWISTNGFIATRVFDAVAIAFGGASFYRNRINTYKKQGYTEEQAEKKTMGDFYQTSEKSQQSADVSKISANQASTTGRILLSFMNTPFQYSRIMKKAAIDIVKGRGSLPNNVGKIVYYGALQNIMFNALQNLVFATMWSDDDDEEETKAKDSKQRTLRTVNGIADNIIKGMGMNYVALSVVKNALIKWYDTTGTPEGVYAPVLELLNISPMVGIKFRQVLKGIKALEYNKELNPEGDKVIPAKAMVEAATSFVSVGTNIPADRLYQKIENISGALDSQNEDWQRIALAFGYSKQNLGIKDEEEDTGSATRGSSLKSPGLSGGGLKSPGLK